MSKNIDQVFIANPITSNASTDLMYFGQSPYGVGNDAAMTFANFSAQFGAPYTASALTANNDTNVTLTLGGTPATALLHAASITAGWTGQLAVNRGGTGLASMTTYAILAGGTTSTGNLQQVSGLGSSGDVLTSNGAGALPTWQPAAGGGVTAAQIQDQAFTYAVSSGSANAIAISLSPALSAYADGQIVSFRSGANNTGATTVTTNALSTKQLFVAGANACVGGELQGGSPYLAQYDSASGAYFLLNPSMFPPSSLQAGNLPTNVQLQINSFNSGTGASSSTFWRGDGTWAAAGGGGGGPTLGQTAALARGYY